MEITLPVGLWMPVVCMAVVGAVAVLYWMGLGVEVAMKRWYRG